MVSTTILQEHELNQPSGDTLIDELLIDVRKISGRDYQVVRCTSHRGIGPFKRNHSSLRLYVFVDGLAPWQELNAQSPEAIRAYLRGLLNGYQHTAERTLAQQTKHLERTCKLAATIQQQDHALRRARAMQDQGVTA